MKSTKDFRKMKVEGQPIVMLTAYDAPGATFAENAGVDTILVGDSLGMVVLGYESTVPVTMDDMIHHTKAVKRGAKDTFIITDMPFMSYHASQEDTVANARRIMQEAGADAVKLEGNQEVFKMAEVLIKGGIPVVCHLGLTPQSVGVLGGYHVQGKTDKQKEELIYDAKEVDRIGASMLVLECVPEMLAEEISQLIEPPVIGIGAGRYTDGQVLVYHDLIGGGKGDHYPKFVKSYASVKDDISQAIKHYVDDVKKRTFPEEKHVFFAKETITEQKPYGGKSGS